MNLKHPDLLVMLFVIGLSLIFILSGFRGGNIEYETAPMWVAPFGILMVLFIPGYSIVTGLLPDIGIEKTLLFSLGVSIAISAVGGLLLDLTTWGLNPVTWCLWLSIISLLGVAWAWHHRRIHMQNFDVGLPVLQRENVFIFGFASFLLLASVFIAYLSSSNAETTFTQLWALPTVTADHQYQIQIGIRNEEKQMKMYDLYIDEDGRRLEEWPVISLGSGNEWTTTIQLPEEPARPIQISLYHADDLNNIYRWLRISPDAFK